MRHIRIVVPIVVPASEVAERYSMLGSVGTEISVVAIQRGPASIESEFESALAVPDVLLAAHDSARNGANAVIIHCMDDPGLAACRELLSIPVIGPAQTSMHFAALLGHRFTVVAAGRGDVAAFENQALINGLRDRLASVRWLGIPVLELRANKERMVAALVTESVQAVEGDGAHVIVFGCMAMCGTAESVRNGLRAAGHPGVPVIDPMPLTVRVAETLIDLGLSQSRCTYPRAPLKAVVGYAFDQAVPE